MVRSARLGVVFDFRRRPRRETQTNALADAPWARYTPKGFAIATGVSDQPLPIHRPHYYTVLIHSYPGGDGNNNDARISVEGGSPPEPLHVR